MFQVQEHSLRPLTTAHLAQTMTLLALSNLELREKVEASIEQRATSVEMGMDRGI